MAELPKKYLETLNKAIKNIKIADHIVYVTYPVINDKRLLLKSLDHIYEALIEIINSILQYDYFWQKIQLSKEAKVNFDTFAIQCSKRYNITTEEIAQIVEAIVLAENHRKSAIEFLRKEKIVIMNDNLKTTTLEPEKLKKYLNLLRKLLEKAKFGMSIQ